MRELIRQADRIGSSTPPRSERRLTEVAKRVAYPLSEITHTDWTEIRDTCRDDMGIEFDGWQDGMGTLLLAKNQRAKLVHTVGGFGLSAMRQIGKCLDVRTDILTVNRGWTTMADIQVGDQVIHPSGQTTLVTAVHPVLLGANCYEVVTTDGRRIVTDADHLWTVSDKRKLNGPLTQITTAEMLSSGLSRALSGSRSTTCDGKPYQTTEYRFVLPQQQRLELSRQQVPIDPYLLGAWLGDGTGAHAALWCGQQDLDHWKAEIAKTGYVPVAHYKRTAWRIGINAESGRGRNSRTFISALRQLGVLNNKHIPEQYLRGSIDQRLALLQGLLDTDGHATTKGLVEFCTTTRDLADGVLFLARSLGWRANLSEGKAKLNGRDCGIKYRVTFTPKTVDGLNPFRLARKASRILATDGGKGRFTVAIKSIEPVATRPVRCIKVASPDGLFLAGHDLIATHNTYFFAGSFFGMCQKYPGLLVIWSAHHSKTHNETFEAMQGFAERTRVKPFIKKVYTGSGDEEVRFHNGSRILFGARERGFGRGIPGVDVLMSDEGQIMSERAMQNMLATLNTSDIGLHIYAGTPPKPEDNSEAWMRMRGEAWVIEDPDIVTTETEDMVWIEIGADDDAGLDDINQWAKNPSFPHRTPVEAFLRLRRKLNDEGWRREGLGLYDKDEGSAFDISKWNTLSVEDAPEPERAALVLDISPDQRWSSIGIASTLPAESVADEDRTLLMVKTFPGTRGVVKAIREMDTTKELIDISITAGAARALEDELTRANFEWHQMSAGEMAASYGTLKKGIRDSLVAHLDQPELNFALINAKKRYLQTGEAEAFDRREVDGVVPPDISPAVAVASALYRFGLMDEPMPFVG